MNGQTLQPAAIELPQSERLQNDFLSTKREGLCALLSYIPAYLYASYFGNLYASPSEKSWHLGVIAAFLILITEILNYERKRSPESFVWLGCFVLCTASAVCRLGTIWNEDQRMLFVHVFAVWWILSRSGKLLEGRSGHLLPADALNAFFRIPFSRFFLRIRCLIYNVLHLRPEQKPQAKRRTGWLVLTAVPCLLLFILSASLLMRADASFDRFFRRLFDCFRFEIDEDAAFWLFASLPVGAWLFGLMGGSVRLPEETLGKRRGAIEDFLNRIRKIPVLFWICTVGLFSLLYLGFFILQGTYLFGAFTRTLPEGFIVSQYAREGFFELCKVMAVNFSVLWLVTRMASEEASESRAFLAVCLVLLLESMLFAVIAFSKLYLYISCFGFTPKRLQSVWLVCVLFAGCLLWAYTLLTNRPVFRKWMFFGAVTLTVLTLF